MKTIAITGANRGIGLAAARHLAADGHRTVLICRDEHRGRDALDSLAALPGGAEHHLVVADLSSLASVREGAAAVADLGFTLDSLVNNAAVLVPERTLSRDGFEIQLAVTHLAHFLLTTLLLPRLRRRPGKSRVVTVASAAHSGPPFDFDDPGFATRPYKRTRAYQQSKLANILFTFALARRTTGTGIEPVALHPGVYDTGLLRNYVGRVPGGGLAATVFAGKPDRAGPILAELAAGRSDENLTGAYLDKGSPATPSRAALDEEAQERLWEWSESAVGM